MELINEWFVFSATVHMLLFCGDYAHSEKNRFMLGFSLIILAIVMTLTNIGVVLYEMSGIFRLLNIRYCGGRRGDEPEQFDYAEYRDNLEAWYDKGLMKRDSIMLSNGRHIFEPK